MKNILAKSTGQSLEDHSVLVSKFAEEIAKQSILDLNDEILKIIKISSLLHDIGKCTQFFQKKLNSISDELIEEKLPNSLKFRHNEIGWAFLSRYLNGVNKESLDKILNVVYWHHGISNQFGKDTDTDIEQKITESELKTMVGFANYIISKYPEIKNISFEEKDYNPKKTPPFFVSGEDYSEKNAINLLIRGCVISADRLASKYEDATDEEIKNIVVNYNKVDYNVELTNHKYYDNKRFNEQCEITKLTDKTTQINAPAGFGKTLLGLLHGIERNRRIIWVCPTNVISESVYKTINEELELFGLNDISVELFLTNEVKKSTHISKGFDSNIIVTNIDNFLTPSINNNAASRLYTVINSDVIFDEFHELVSKDSALFACFINIMVTRNRYTKANTLLLSATPTNVSFLWDSIGCKTKILPEKHTHYPAAHDVKYLLKTIEGEINAEPDSSSLVIMNSIKNSQLNKNKNNCELLLHSSFIKEDKKNNLSTLYERYGKKSDRRRNKKNVMGTPIIQASLDVSFYRLYESILSPESTLQRIGRCNRWGDYLSAEVITMLFDNRSEDATRGILYSKNLSNTWFDHLKQYNGQELCLNDFYNVYNDFQRKHEQTLKKDLNDSLIKSLDVLALIYPNMYFIKSKSKNISAGGNKLRSNGNEIFVIAPYYNDLNKFTDAFSVTIRKDWYEEFKENNNSFKKIQTTWKNLRDNNDIRFDFNDMINSFKHIPKNTSTEKFLSIIRNNAKKIETPYIRFDKVYHPDYGLISVEDLNLIK